MFVYYNFVYLDLSDKIYNITGGMMQKKRLIGIGIIGWIEVIVGSLAALMSLVSLAFSNVRSSLLYFSLGVVFVLSICLIVGGILMLKLKRIGRLFNIAVMVLMSAIAVLPKAGMTIANIVINSAVVFMFLLVIYYLTRSKVKDQFG
jgi:hypothetical protein